jgi:uncharacterized protein
MVALQEKNEKHEKDALTNVTPQKLEQYFHITTSAIKKVKLQKADEVFDIDAQSAAKDFFDMASRYVADAEYFEKQGNRVLAFAALNYAHGWLDAGARLGLFDVGADNVLFTVDEEHVEKLKKLKTTKKSSKN